MFRTYTLFAAALLAPLILNAQEKPAEPEPPAPRAGAEATLIHVKTLGGDSFVRLTKLLKVISPRFTSDERLRTILVYDSPQVVAQMRKVIDALDRPGSEAAIGHNIDLTLSLLKCSTNPQDAAGAPLPADLEPVAKQLRAATTYKSIQLWDILPMRIQEGRQSQQSGFLPSPADASRPATRTEVIVQPSAVVSRDNGRFVRFDKIEINLFVPKGGAPAIHNERLSLVTSGDYKEGQKTVFGKLSGVESDSAVFFVITLKVLD